MIPPYGFGPGNPSHILWGRTRPPLILQWEGRTQTEALGVQNSAENPDSLGWKISYAPFVSADGTQSSQVGNQTRPPIQSLHLTPPWGPGVRGWEGECVMVAEEGKILTSLGRIIPSLAS